MINNVTGNDNIGPLFKDLCIEDYSSPRFHIKISLSDNTERCISNTRAT